MAQKAIFAILGEISNLYDKLLPLLSEYCLNHFKDKQFYIFGSSFNFIKVILVTNSDCSMIHDYVTVALVI